MEWLIYRVSDENVTQQEVKNVHQKLMHTFVRAAKVRGEELEVKPWMCDN